jgi:hypothetical protein
MSGQLLMIGGSHFFQSNTTDSNTIRKPKESVKMDFLRRIIGNWCVHTYSHKVSLSVR